MTETTEEQKPADKLQAIVSLHCRDLRVGACIILNDVEQPCGRLVAVVTSIVGSRVTAKYLNAEKMLDSYNKASGCATTKDLATPLGLFGVIVRIDSEGVYWCDPICESIAKYPDGSTRPWQERGYRGRYVARPDVLALAHKSG